MHISYLLPVEYMRYRLTRQTQFGMHSESVDALSEGVGGHDVYLIEQEKPPFPRSNPLHDLLGIVGSLTRDTDHRIGRNDDTGGSSELWWSDIA